MMGPYTVNHMIIRIIMDMDEKAPAREEIGSWCPITINISLEPDVTFETFSAKK